MTLIEKVRMILQEHVGGASPINLHRITNQLMHLFESQERIILKEALALHGETIRGANEHVKMLKARVTELERELNALRNMQGDRHGSTVQPAKSPKRTSRSQPRKDH